MACVVYLTSLFAQPYGGQFLLKALPVIFLLACLHLRTIQVGKISLMLALAFSAAGDVLLALSIEQNFVFGLAAFLLAQLCYQGCFWRFFHWQKSRLLQALVVVLVASSVYWLLLPDLAELAVPVLAYMVVLCLMAISAVFAGINCRKQFYGALLFLLSDTLIAWDRFISPIPYQAFYIMLSYYLAQYYLLTGAIQLIAEKQH